MSVAYSVLYKISMSLLTPEDSFVVPSDDIISIAIINEYDTNTYPIVRIRLYTDITTYHMLAEYPNNIQINVNMDGGIYKMAEQTDNSRSPQLVRSCKSINMSMKGYIERKNAPSSKYDDYENGIKKNSSLNTSVKVPMELFGYNEALTHMMRQKVRSIYKNLSLQTTLENLFQQNQIHNFDIETIKNSTKWNQILIPNLSCLDAISFLDTIYGLYDKGGIIFGDWDGIHICSSDVNNGTKTIPIYVDSKDSNSDMSGMQKYGDTFMMVTQAPNVNVITETDIERVLNSYFQAAINLNDMDINVGTLDKLYGQISHEIQSRISIADKINAIESKDASSVQRINNSKRALSKYESIYGSFQSTPDILHKSKSPYVVNAYIARIIENITRVDVSGVGFDISQFNISSRYNLIFKSPIRGIDMNNRYRARFVNHVLTNLDSGLFTPTTTLTLCSN